MSDPEVPTAIDSAPVVAIPPRRRRVWGLVPLPIVALVLGSLYAWHNAPADEAKAGASKTRRALPVVVERITPVDLPIELRYPAELDAIQEAEVQPMQIRGYVTKLFVDKGDVVKAGQTLARLDCTPYTDERMKLEEAAHQAEARQHFAAQTIERIKPMAAQSFMSAQDLAAAESEAATADASLAHAKASISEAQHKIGYCDLQAPFSGSIRMRYVDPGALVGPGQSVVSIVDNSAVRVMLHVVEADVGRVAIGQAAELVLDAYPGRSFKGRVQRIVDAVDPKTRTMLIEIDVPNSDGSLKPGMFGRVALTVGQHKGAIVAPARALVVTEDGTFVFVAAGDVARRKKITLGFDDGERVEVTGGLAAGDEVVVVGQDLVGDGVPIVAHGEDGKLAAGTTR